LSAKHADVHVIDASSPEDAAERIRTLDTLAGRKLKYALRAELTARYDEADAKATAAHARSPEAGDAALVGNYQQVADRLAQYLDAGVSTLVLSARPHLEEAYRIAQHVLPRLPGWGVAQLAQIAAE